MDWTFYPDVQRWYHFYFCRGPQAHDINRIILIRDGHYVYARSNIPSNEQNVENFSQDLVIGENLDGWMEEIRISSDYTYGGARVNDYTDWFHLISKSVPTAQYQRYYTMSLYERL
jgi:hypothetical protein